MEALKPVLMGTIGASGGVALPGTTASPAAAVPQNTPTDAKLESLTAAVQQLVELQGKPSAPSHVHGTSDVSRQAEISELKNLIVNIQKPKEVEHTPAERLMQQQLVALQSQLTHLQTMRDKSSDDHDEPDTPVTTVRRQWTPPPRPRALSFGSQDKHDKMDVATRNKVEALDTKLSEVDQLRLKLQQELAEVTKLKQELTAAPAKKRTAPEHGNILKEDAVRFVEDVWQVKLGLRCASVTEQGLTERVLDKVDKDDIQQVLDTWALEVTSDATDHDVVMLIYQTWQQTQPERGDAKKART